MTRVHLPRLPTRRNWIIRGILNRGDVLMIYGSSGVGKSIYIANIVASLLDANTVLKLWESRRSRILIADYEMPQDEIKDRYALLTDLPQSLVIKSFQGEKLDGDMHFQLIDDMIRFMKIDVLVIDPLSAAYDVNIESRQLVGKFMQKLRRTARRNSCAMIIAHHTGKPLLDEFGDEVTTQPRGHISINDAIDIELQVLSTSTHDRTTLLCTKSKPTSTIQAGWRRDFRYDNDSLRLTPMHEYDDDKELLLKRLIRAKRALGMSNYNLAGEFNVTETQARRWAFRENYPDVPHFSEILDRLEREAVMLSSHDELVPETLASKKDYRS